jgi:CHRD domain
VRIVKPQPPPYLTRVDRGDQRRQRQVERGRKRRRLALTIAVILLAVVVVALALILPGGKKTAGPTSTSTRQAPSSSTTSTSLPATTTASTARGPANGALTYSALLSGKNETPALSTSAGGTLKLTVAADGSSVHYLLSVSKITDITVARLHEGKAGTSGATILTLYGGPIRRGVFSGVLAQGSFTAANLQGPLKGKKVADLVALIKSGKVYLNAGTSTHPGGEIRGQIK